MESKDRSNCKHRRANTGCFNGFICCEIKAPGGIISEDTCLGCDEYHPLYVELPNFNKQIRAIVM